jgi:hypothetical protein
MTDSIQQDPIPDPPRLRSPVPAYSPKRRTALILTGTGTEGAYHAGVLRALREAGVRIDLVAGHGIGTLGAMFEAVDGASRLWDEKGFWRSPGIQALYPWRGLARVSVAALGVSLGVVLVPIGTVALGLVVYPIDFVLRIVGLSGATSLVTAYLRLTQWAFSPAVLPTWLPRIVVVILGLVVLLAVVTAWVGRTPRRRRGGFWWEAVGPPLSSAEAAGRCWGVLWDLLRGAARLKQPPNAELSRRFVELVGENLGQPGFRELLIGVHDLDARRDLVFALVSQSRRSMLVRRPTNEAAEERLAEVFDLSGLAKEYLPAALAGALCIPLATGPGLLRFVADAYWRGEAHRLCDRPAIVTRLLNEVMQLGAEQVLIVSAAPMSPGPHQLVPGRVDGRGRLGEYLQSAEAAAVRDATRLAEAGLGLILTIRPDHNPIGPFDFRGAIDTLSDRRQSLDELMSCGYEDAYRQFIEPVVGASDGV